MLKDFKEFIMRGNVLDLAIAVIIGAAFGLVVESLVKDIIMPPIGLLLGNVDFNNLIWDLSGKAAGKNIDEIRKAGLATINYGAFINTIINFLIIAFVIFIVLRVYNRFKKQPAPPEPGEKDCPYCYSSIPIKATRCPNCTSDLKTAA
jgi:large conductance mechanosensitive channel